MNWELKDVKQLTAEPWVNLYEATYDKDGKDVKWIFSSRYSKEKLYLKTKTKTPDAVSVIPRLIQNGEEYLVMIKEFRPVVNDYVYSFPAGLVEDNESVLSSAIREVKEEIGADISNITYLSSGFNTEGLTDETTEIYLADVSNLNELDLQDNEDIERVIVNVKDLKEFMQDKLFSAKAHLFCSLYYKFKVEETSKDSVIYKFVNNINDYVELNVKLGNMDMFWVKKINSVKARVGAPGEVVTTILNDGTKEVTNIVKVDPLTNQPDYVVTNSFGEEYVVDFNTFNLKYKETDLDGIYAPISSPIRAVRVNENIEFETAFKKLFKVKKDDYLIIPPNRNIYGITKEAMYENYTFVKE